MRIGVCVPCYKRLNFTKFCVPLAIQNAGKNGMDVTWYLVDDYSEDGTHEFLVHLEAVHVGTNRDVRAMRNQENMGIARTRNKVYKMMLKSDCDIFCNIDNDLLLPYNWLRDMAHALEASYEFSVAAPWFVNDNNIKKNLEKTMPLDKLPDAALVECAVGGGCVLYKREIFEKGLFYPDTKANWTYQDSQHHGKIRHCGYKVGLYTGVQAWLLERLVWDPMEEEKLRIRHAHLNKGSLEGFEENLARRRRSVPF